jgi:hypothetical protein
MRLHQAFDFLAQLAIADADVDEERTALFGATPDRVLEDVVDAPPSIRVHSRPPAAAQ